jgi:hypothetical protein
MTGRIDEDQRSAGGGLTRRTFLGQSTAVIAGAVVSANGGEALGALSSSDSSVPVLLRASDAVKPGQLFSVNGEWLNSANLEVLVSAREGKTPPKNVLTASIVQTDDQGHFVVATLPPQLAPGIFHVWVKNGAGSSAPIVINQPRPLFLSEFEAWAGQQIKIVGRNFDPGEYGAQGVPRVRLANGTDYREASVVKHNPYAITITVPAVETTRYWAEVSTDGATWWRMPLDEHLDVVPVGKDPLGLGVAWADHFNWSRAFNVADHGVPTTGGVDVTAQVQAVVDAIKAAGGGVVYFPEGEFRLSGIALPASVVLLGAGVNKSKLISTAVGGNFINSSGDGAKYGRQGISHLTVELEDPDIRPDTFFWLGEQWGQNNNVNDLTVRTASELFVKNVNLNYALVPPPVTSGQRGVGIEWIAKSRALCEDCKFVGYCAVPYINYITNYYTVKRNYFEFCTGVIVDSGSRCFYEDNRVVGQRRHARSTDDLHGLFARDRVYMANNVVEGVGSLGDNNDGEALCVEVPNANFNCGSVTAASVTTLRVNPQVPLVAPLVYFGYLAVAIVDGRGLGQLRRVTNVDSTNNLLTISASWGVVPDTTSVFTLMLPLEQVTYYRNSIRDCWKGLWFFGNTYDSVQAENTSTDSEGIFMWTERNPGALIPGYFARIARNKIVGISPKSRHGGISCYTGQFDQNGANHRTLAYGFEALDNTISGVPNSVPIDATEAPPYSGLTVIAAPVPSSFRTRNPVAGFGKNTILSRNQLTKLTTGVTIDHSLYGTLVANNTYTATVTTFLQNQGGNLDTMVFNNKQV